jgi:hypothetical protein
MRIFALLWAFAVAACSLSLIGADSNPFPPPTVVVYPLTGIGGTPPEAGGNVALLLSSKLSELGGLEMRPYTPGTTRAQFLAAALAQNDDYYITGYLTPVGSEVSLIVQIVSTQSGSVVYSTSATVETYADVVAQADLLRAAILRHAGRGLPSVGDVEPVSTPAPLASNGSVNLTRALGRHARNEAPPPTAAASAASASPAVVANLPASATSASAAPVTAAPATAAPHAAPKAPAAAGAKGNGLVVDIDGDAPADERAHAQVALANVLVKAGLHGEILHVSSTDAQAHAAALCAANAGATAFFIGTLSNDDGALNFSVTAEGCNGTTAAQTASAQDATRHGGVMGAIDRAASADAVALSAAVATLATPKP